MKTKKEHKDFLCWCGEDEHGHDAEYINTVFSKIEHAPTPWQVKDNGNALLILGGGSHVATLTHDDHLGYPDEANAAFIVRAVNSHENSIFVMRHALAEIKGEGVITKKKIIEWLEQAINEANGGKV